MKHYFYTDGGCCGNPGPGGWAAIELESRPETGTDVRIINILKGREKETTNNRMELTAILEVLKRADENVDDTYIINSDSAYAVNSIVSWMERWSANNWKNSKGKTVENLDLMKELYHYYNKNSSRCQIFRINGHAGNIGNELADAYATNNQSKIDKLFRIHNIIEN